MASTEIIAAIATAPGRAGIGVVRVSGPDLSFFAKQLTGMGAPSARQASLRTFRDAQGAPLDQGLLLYFPAPASFTGEDVLEIQGHGGDSVLRLLLLRCQELGARLAQPGEFTQRAYLNHKLDLAQAEAVADLIDAESQAAVRGALRSLRGVFSEQVNALVVALIDLRLRVEGSIDFADEGIEFLAQANPADRINELLVLLADLLHSALQGSLLRTGRRVVLVGAPNVGKSSLLNALAEESHAIVTDIPGTTRDAIRTTVLIEGVPFHIVDTAGIRPTQDPVEQAGIERTWAAIADADLALIMTDVAHDAPHDLLTQLPQSLPRLLVRNKVDLRGGEFSELRGQTPNWGLTPKFMTPNLEVSAKTGEGLAALKALLLQQAGWQSSAEPPFMARERHVAALREAQSHLQLALNQNAVELLAESLRLAQQALTGITGHFSADDLLGEIFSRFCIGK